MPQYPSQSPYAGQYPVEQQPAYGSQQSYSQQSDYPPSQYGQQEDLPDAGLQYPSQNYQPARALNTEQLEQLVAPIALYPDTLVAQVLAAATYPAQVVDADHWRQAQGYGSADQIAFGADAQSWDPSVKALTAFPQLLAELDQNIRWTIALGNAYYNQPQDVLDVVQVMRQRAQAAGNLQSTPQEGVTYDQGYIQLAPVNPQVVYLPVYNPWTAYGEPIQPYRGFSLVGALGSFFGSSAVRYGLGIAMSAFSHTSFGWLGWGLDWLTHSLLFHNSSYYSHSTTVADWGLPHGGPRAVFQHGTMAARSPNSYRPQSNYGRPGGAYSSAPTPRFAEPARRYAENRSPQTYAHNYPSPGMGYARPPMEAYNRTPSGISRPESYYRPAPTFGSNSYRTPSSGVYGARPSPAYRAPQQAYRAPAPAFQQRGEFAERSSRGYEGRGYSESVGREPKSGGFHLFGGGHESKMSEPKMSGNEKKFSSRHSDGGGHSGGHGGGKHRR